MFDHPCRWCFVEWPTFDFLHGRHGEELRPFLAKDIGRVLATSANDIYIVPQHTARLWDLDSRSVVGITEGDEMRNWSAREPQLLLRPYNENWSLIKLRDAPHWRNGCRAFDPHWSDAATSMVGPTMT